MSASLGAPLHAASLPLPNVLTLLHLGSALVDCDTDGTLLAVRLTADSLSLRSGKMPRWRACATTEDRFQAD